MSETPSCGHMVWYDLMSPDPKRSAQFYRDLLGWEIKDVDMGVGRPYTMIHNQGESIGGIESTDPSQQVPAHWIAYVSVSDLEGAVKKAESMGGKIPVRPKEIPNVGRFAVVVDPTGAMISPYQSANPSPDWKPSQGPGNFCWNELLTHDTGSAGKFYAEVFGWNLNAHGTGELGTGEVGTYYVFQRGESWAAGMMQMPAEAQAPSHWIPYIAVNDVDASARRAKELGAKVFVEPRDIPDVGRFSVLQDPVGATFALFKGPAQD